MIQERRLDSLGGPIGMEKRGLRSDRGRSRDMKIGRECSHSLNVKREYLLRQILNKRALEKTLESIRE
jgi:hypothetical protein